MSSFIWRNRPTKIYATVAATHESGEEKEFGVHQKTRSIAYGYELFVFYRLWNGFGCKTNKKVTPRPVGNVALSLSLEIHAAFKFRMLFLSPCSFGLLHAKTIHFQYERNDMIYGFLSGFCAPKNESQNTMLISLQVSFGSTSARPSIQSEHALHLTLIHLRNLSFKLLPL